MEFLMTYGWAILAAIIAFGVLTSFGVFHPDIIKDNSQLQVVYDGLGGVENPSLIIQTGNIDCEPFLAENNFSFLRVEDPSASANLVMMCLLVDLAENAPHSAISDFKKYNVVITEDVRDVSLS